MISGYSGGDLAHTFSFRNTNWQLKSQVADLSAELTTGKTSNPRTHLSGNLSIVSELERAISISNSYSVVANEASFLATSMQNALSFVQSDLSETAIMMLQSGTVGAQLQVGLAADNASASFENVVGALNTRVAGRSIFAGNATDSIPIASPESMLSDLTTLVAGEVTASAVIAAVSDWFDLPGGGFETSAYQGSTATSGKFTIGANENIVLASKGDDPEFRDSLKSLALGAIVARGILGSNPAEQSELMAHAGELGLAANDALTDMQSKIGQIQGQIETATTRHNTEIAASQLALGDLLSVDPYETAVKLETAQTRLETVFQLTSRLSQLSLLGYLR